MPSTYKINLDNIDKIGEQLFLCFSAFRVIIKLKINNLLSKIIDYQILGD